MATVAERVSAEELTGWVVTAARAAASKTDADGHGQQNLNRCAKERDVANGLEFFERKFNAERKQEQSHTDFGQQLDLVDR